eukprot:5873073-Heterocapsa_arctica.AAC.1
MEMYSASHVLDAVEPWRLERHANGQQRSPSAERASSQRPDVLLVVSMSPLRSASGDMTITHVSMSVDRNVPQRSTSG